ncbi:MAG: hypothetical protein KAI40_05440 [Desulfobacterales bacterium]|nr:hypothetical protein [Desulfobacterales bacterium]
MFEDELEKLKKKRSDVPKHIDFGDLPDDLKFKKLKSSSRLLLNTIKMIDYRAETAMSMTLKEFLNRGHDARSIIQELFTTEADIVADHKAKRLIVKVHRMNPCISRLSAGSSPKTNHYILFMIIFRSLFMNKVKL